MNEQKILEISEVELGYKDELVIDKFSWNLFYGDRYIISGPNGCGKTTLIKTILGLIMPRKGEIKFFNSNGKVVNKVNMGYLPQVTNIDKAFPIKVSQVIDSALPYGGITRRERKQKIEFLLNKVELDHLTDKSISNLSGGQLQRLLLARSLATNPDLLVLDEPMSFLDEDYKSTFHTLLDRLVSTKAVILMVTHERNDFFNSWKSLAL